MIALIVILVLLLGAAAWLGWAGRVLVPTDHVGIVRRRIARRTDPYFRRITPHNDTRGIQARILQPDHVYWLIPGVHAVDIVPCVRVPRGMIGLVTAHAGCIRPSHRPLGTHVECHSFQDGQAFLLGGGEQGTQVTTLAGDQSYYINTKLFTVDLVPRTYVPPGTVGLVNAKAGQVRPPDRPFGRYVECDGFQDGQAFLARGGEQGRQLAILAGGTYYDINPELFEVFTVDNVGTAQDGLRKEHLGSIEIPIGHTGVVVTLDGAEPERDGAGNVAPLVSGHSSFRLPWVFLERGGRRGVQEETLGEGTVYALNPWFVRVVQIPTRVLILEWTSKGRSESRNYDMELEQIVVNIQGYRLRVEVKQTLQIPEKAAPGLVSQFGGQQSGGLGGLVDDPVPVQRFVERVLGSVVGAYFNEIAGAGNVWEFLRQYRETRTDLAAQVRNALLPWGVEAKTTMLGEFESEDPRLNEALKMQFEEQMRGERLREERLNVDVEDEIDAVRVERERRRARLELEAEINALGRENVAMIRIIREISKMQVPDIIGGSDISGYVQALPLPAVRDMIGKLRELRSDPQLGEAGPPHFGSVTGPVRPTPPQLGKGGPVPHNGVSGP